MKNHFFAVVAVVVLLAASCAQRVDIQAEQTAAKKVVDEFQKAMENNDIKLMSRIMAHDTDMVNFGTDAAERWVGYEAFKKAVEEQFAAFENTKLSVKDQRIKVHRSGGAASQSVPSE
jgi:ketosteroid isomerase-like protein